MAKKSTMNAAIPMQERKWRAESDARIMMEHKQIMADPARCKAAVKAARGMAAEQMANAKAMNAVAKKKVK